MKSSQDTADKDKRSFPTKILIRRLPPSLSAETFLEEVSPLPDHNYFSYVTADKSLGQFAFCRAVINFSNPDDVIVFKEKFDDYVFVDPKGNEYPAVVEFAPYQKVPLSSRKQDHRENTIENDPEFKRFVESLENPETTPALTVKEIMEEVDARAKEKQAAISLETPLIAFINKFKLEKRRMQEKLKEEKRLRDQEKRRQKDEERRQRREREKKAKDSSSTSSSASDGKKAVGKDKDDSRPSSVKSGKADSAKSSHGKSDSGKAGDKGAKGAGSSKYKDDIIVRTLPSKGKSSSDGGKGKFGGDGLKGKKSADKGRPASGKTQTGSKSLSEQPRPNSGKGDGKKEGVGAASSKSESKQSKLLSSGAETSNATKQSSDATTTKEKVGKAGDSGATEAAKPKSDRPHRPDRSFSEDSNSSRSEGDKGAANKGSKRHKDRPARAIYNPAARAAERRQKQTKPGTETPSGDKPANKSVSENPDS